MVDDPGRKYEYFQNIMENNMMTKNKLACLITAVSALLLGPLAGTAQAAVITWQTPVDASGDGTGDIDNTGTLLYAFQYGLETSDLTIDGVTFADVSNGSSGTSFTSDSASFQQTDVGTVPGTSGDYETLLRQNAYNTQDNNPWTLTGLTSGNEYLVQFWSADVRFGATQYTTYEGGGSTSDQLLQSTGQYVIGTFTADGTTQEINMGTDNQGILNAMQLRAVPEPATAGLLAAAGTLLLIFRRRMDR